MTYTHESLTERYQIYALMQAGQTQSEIAQILGRHKSTISREISRDCGRRGYRPRQAQNLLMSVRKAAVMPEKLMNRLCLKCDIFSVCNGVLSK